GCKKLTTDAKSDVICYAFHDTGCHNKTFGYNGIIKDTGKWNYSNACGYNNPDAAKAIFDTLKPGTDQGLTLSGKPPKTDPAKFEAFEVTTGSTAGQHGLNIDSVADGGLGVKA